MAAVVDANPLIGLAKGDAFQLLNEVFGEVLIPPTIWKEVVEDGAGMSGAAETEAARQADWCMWKRRRRQRPA